MAISLTRFSGDLRHGADRYLLLFAIQLNGLTSEEGKTAGSVLGGARVCQVTRTIWMSLCFQSIFRNSKLNFATLALSGG